MQAPTILDEQETIIQWARTLRNNYMSVSSIIYLLVTDKLDKKKADAQTLIARQIYQGYNRGWQDSILFAIQLDAYRKEHDIQEGQIVTDGEFVGFASKFNWNERTFGLFSNKSCAKDSYIGRFTIDPFKAIRR
ncbi:hypothetical protein PP175_25370 (plasmid) [Aneurinibacillus sp. Ricciae_BoGa-3]|uniref:hypothetical protein n=1 Tax=Aneurinibacillus sp. Ricciae_BoGa-3 TaxID=3022697 RepID=UPI00234188A3|nr:hypothetical protein [Aneurinibacillus sp. Ricciae_BoGa-3]WCK57400.1 hypothetical protein PP175_25370 [Aneurinibacillus sp. Ricciae_BoGa-3]